MHTLEEYRGASNWEGLIPGAKEPRVWDEGFRSFLIKYGMLNHIVYDVFVKGEDGDKDERGLRGTCRYKDDMDAFTKKGLEFRYVDKSGKHKEEYDFTNEYQIVGNIVCSPRSFFSAEDNWFGFVTLSNDKKEMVIVFRGTETNKEWVENVTLTLSKLECASEKQSGLRCHSGFQQLYEQESTQGLESPQQTVNRLAAEHKATLEKVTVLGHSLGGAMCQLCAVDLAYTKVLGDIPILAIAWGAPKVGNKALAAWADTQQNLRVLRIRNPLDTVPNVPPDWMWSLFSGGFKHLGTEISLSNAHLHKEGVVKGDDGNSPNHNLQMYLHNIDPTRDVALMNKVGNVVPEEYALKHNISPMWHSQTWPRTIYNKK